jgi:hypothetical protein
MNSAQRRKFKRSFLFKHKEEVERMKLFIASPIKQMPRKDYDGNIFYQPDRWEHKKFFDKEFSRDRAASFLRSHYVDNIPNIGEPESYYKIENADSNFIEENI